MVITFTSLLLSKTFQDASVGHIQQDSPRVQQAPILLALRGQELKAANLMSRGVKVLSQVGRRSGGKSDFSCP